MLKGFAELFTSYAQSSEKHARGVYVLTSYYHTPKSFNLPFVCKIGMSMNLYNRMNSYELYYPEGFYALGFVFLPLSADSNDVLSLERAIHETASSSQYANEWFRVRSFAHLHQILLAGSKAFPKARVVTDLAKKIVLSSEYIPMPLKDLKVIRKIEAEYEKEKRQREEEKRKREIEMKKPKITNNLPPAYNTRFFKLKRSAGSSKETAIEL